MVHIAFDVNDAVRRKFKSTCAEHGDEMSAILRKAVDEYISSKNVKIVKS